jgi:hypothetical protein
MGTRGAGDGGRHVVVGRASRAEGIDLGEALALGGQRRPVDRVVHRAPQPDMVAHDEEHLLGQVVGEQRSARILGQIWHDYTDLDWAIPVSAGGELSQRENDGHHPIP